MSTTPQDPYGTDDDRDRTSGSPSSGGDTPPAYGSAPPPPPYGSTPAYGGSSSYGGGSSSYGSTPPPYGSTPPSYGSTPPSYGGDPGQGPYGYGGGFPKNNLGVWSLVLGLVGIFVCGLFAGIPAIVLGHKARRAVAEGQANNPGMATAGIVLGWVTTVLSLLAIIAAVFFIATGTMTGFETVDTTGF